MRPRFTSFVLGTAVAAFSAASLADDHRHERGAPRNHGKSFERIATLPNYRNAGGDAIATVSEIVAATENGRLLIYTDASAGTIGLVSIHFPAFPIPLGTVDVGGDPTSVDTLGNKYALVGVNTSASFTNPSGHLAVVDIGTRAIEATLDLGGQPDSVKISPDGRYAAIAIENERDEEVTVDGVEGGLPQTPAGYLAIVDLVGSNPAAWTVRKVELAGLAEYGPDDPETEFVDINADNEVVVTLQENNHVVIVALPSGDVVGDFPAGTVDLDLVDAVEDGVISLSSSLAAVPREPDAVTWIEGRGAPIIATANEGDLFGGSRGFTFFDRDGNVLFDSGHELEHIAVRHGHYPEDRSENKGTEPEAIEFGVFGKDRYVFVGSERGSFVAVYEVNRDGRPEFRQLLPAPLGPEGVLAIPQRNLLVVSGEEDDPTFGVRSTMMIYELKGGSPSYPQIVSSDDASGLPIPWSALSGMDAVPGRRSELLAVWDSYYAESRIFRIDASRRPALITEAVTIKGGTGNYDPEGIVIAPDGTYWVASEGNADARLNRLLQVDPDGTLGSGFEGLAVLRGLQGSYDLLVAQQRGWDYTTPECEALDDDAAGLNALGEPNLSRIWIYDPETGAWNHSAWELAPLPANASWVGLSEITAAPDGSYVVIERDNRTGDWTGLKTLVRFGRWAAWDGMVSAADKAVYDLIPAMSASRGWITDKPEGTAITRKGEVFVVTDNDGVEDWSGETSFLPLGDVDRLFRSKRRY